MRLLDVEGDGICEVLASGGLDGIALFDHQGKVVFSRGEDEKGKPSIQGPPKDLAAREGGVWLIDLDGKNYTRYDAPLSHIKLDKPRVIEAPGLSEGITFDTEDVYQAKCVLAELEKDQPKYLAVVANFTALNRSLFYLYDSQGKLIYEEILPEECNAIAILPPENSSGRDEILVSGKKTVWRYAMH